MISVEIKDSSKIKEGLSEVEIYCDSEGLKELQRQLNFLISGESHIHLTTPSWAGYELSEKTNGSGNVLVNQLKISLISKR